MKEESVHLSDWPKINEKLINTKLEKDFKIVLEVIEKGLAERDKAKIGLKWPLSKAIISINNPINKELQIIIMGQLNVKSIEIRKSNKISISLDTKLTAELKSEGFAREISRKVQSSRKKAGLVKTDKIKLGISVNENLQYPS